MHNQTHYRILTPDGRLSRETFSPANEQPSTLHKDCLLVVNDDDRTQLTVHRERLFATATAEDHGRVCLRCGKVLGVSEDQIQCLYDEGDAGELLKPLDDISATQPCAEHSA